MLVEDSLVALHIASLVKLITEVNKIYCKLDRYIHEE